MDESQGLQGTLTRNIDDLRRRARQQEVNAPFESRIAAKITAFTGSMVFVYLHLIVYGGWLVVNLGLVPIVAPFDPTFVFLACEASVEAIFLSTFVLISQNRMAQEADRRAALDLHINLLAEHELTRMAEVLAAIARKLGIEEELHDVRSDVQPLEVLDELDRN